MTELLLSLGVVLATLGRAIQVRRDWRQHGIGGFALAYLVLVAAGNLVLMVAVWLLGAHVAAGVLVVATLFPLWLAWLKVRARPGMRRWR